MTKNKKGKGFSHRKQSPFVSLDIGLIKSPLFRSLKPCSKSVLLELMAQYNGHNNGNLCAPKAYANKWQISATTLYKAIRELEEKQLIIKTRRGLFANGGVSCALYAISWLPIDYCDGLELDTSYIKKIYKSTHQLKQIEL